MAYPWYSRTSRSPDPLNTGVEIASGWSKSRGRNEEILPCPQNRDSGDHNLLRRGYSRPSLGHILARSGLQAVEILDVFFDVVTQTFDDAGFQLPGPLFSDGILGAKVFQGQGGF